MRIFTKAQALLAISFSFVVLAPGQSKYDKAYEKVEVAYVAGDYKGAESALEKFYSKAAKKLGKQNKYTPVYALMKTKIALSSGLLFDFESGVLEVIKQSIALN